MQKKTVIFREGYIDLETNHNIEDVKRVGFALENKFGIKVVQIHLHHINKYFKKHAHIIFIWINQENGRTIKLYKSDLSIMQKVVKQELHTPSKKGFSLIRKIFRVN